LTVKTGIYLIINVIGKCPTELLARRHFTVHRNELFCRRKKNSFKKLALGSFELCLFTQSLDRRNFQALPEAGCADPEPDDLVHEGEAGEQVPIPPKFTVW
jgi:hypothetical protein